MEASAATTSPEPRPKLSHSPMPRSPASSAAAKLAEARFHARYRPAGTVVVDYTVETDSDDLTTDAAVDSGRAIPAPATRHPRPSSSWRNVSGCASDAPPRVSHGVLPLRGCSWIFATQKKVLAVGPQRASHTSRSFSSAFTQARARGRGGQVPPDRGLYPSEAPDGPRPGPGSARFSRQSPRACRHRAWRAAAGLDDNLALRPCLRWH